MHMLMKKQLEEEIIQLWLKKIIESLAQKYNQLNAQIIFNYDWNLVNETLSLESVFICQIRWFKANS